uniref:FecR family protein n=1 Tax=Phenylobacterium sp. TaxID=1871053 RepID=UPI00286D4D9E
MSEAWTGIDNARRDAAAGWLVRLQSADLIEAEAVAFDAWLTAHPGNAPAYDQVLSVTLELEAAAPRIAQALRAPPLHRRPPARRGWIVAGGVAAAAAVAIAVLPFSALRPAPTQTYVTVKGEHRTVRLADGSVLDLNAGSALSVTLARRERQVILLQGEAVFDVAPDKARPFLIAAGDRTVRVVGTRFDVRRRDGQLSVTVERGLVEVRPTEGPSIAGPSVAGPSVAGPSVAGAAIGPRAYRLHPGQRLDHA